MPWWMWFAAGWTLGCAGVLGFALGKASAYSDCHRMLEDYGPVELAREPFDWREAEGVR